MKVRQSDYIATNKALFKKLQQKLAEKYEYASVLVSDVSHNVFQISRSGARILERNIFGSRGFVVRVYDGHGYAEYASNSISDSVIPEIIARIDDDLVSMAASDERLDTPLLSEDEIAFSKSTDYDIHPEQLGEDGILKKITSLREDILSRDERIIDAVVTMDYQEYHKLFISDKKDMEQNLLWTCGALMVMARRGDVVQQAYRGFSLLGGAELLDKMSESIDKVVKEALDLLESEQIVPGEYECICSPDVTGMIVHEAFGHGVEMDMFVKDRALAKDYIGKMIASPLVTMRDGAASAQNVASFFFDDEGVPAHDTLVIDKGMLVSGYSDAVSAARLGVAPTGNGRRESVERKTYTRMTNTFFEGGNDSLEDMIASVKYGMLLESASSGMEDPKNWGIQCMVSVAREIKDGKLTGKIFSPIVLTGYVPDLLKSISMMSADVDISGSGGCGKGSKEWVKVSSGGPWIKARVRLG